MALPSGLSELDTVVLRLPGSGREITNWTRYSYNQAFLTPTAGWSFSVPADDRALVDELLVVGAPVELAMNDRLQCSGFIDKRTIDAGSSGGTVITVQGRDILGRVVDSCIDPAYKFASGSTLADVVLSVLAQFGIDTIYNSDAINVNAVTGLPRGVGATGTRSVKVGVPKRTTQADGSVKLETTLVTGSVTVNTARPDLKAIPLDQVKPRIGEGAYAYLDRILRRQGFMMWAAADGSGVVIDKADFTTAPRHRIIHRRENGASNNVLHGALVQDVTTQPSVIVGFGFGGGRQADKSRLKVAMVNELVGLDAAGAVLPGVATILTRYKGARVLPIRPELVPFTRPVGDPSLAAPMFFQDNDAKTIEQLEASVRREMATRQQKALTVSYEVDGHTQAGAPWAVNSLVDVDDDVRGIHGRLWCVERSFSKSPGSGTMTTIRLIRPYTLQVAT